MKKKKINCILTVNQWSMLHECLRYTHETLDESGSPTAKVVERVVEILDASTEDV